MHGSWGLRYARNPSFGLSVRCLLESLKEDETTEGTMDVSELTFSRNVSEFDAAVKYGTKWLVEETQKRRHTGSKKHSPSLTR